jgi:hypothetical protein
MEHEFKSHWIKSNKALEPIKVMLASRKEKLNRQEWLKFVEHTKTSIIDHPDQYLSHQFPSSETFVTIIDKIFENFLRDQKEN